MLSLEKVSRKGINPYIRPIANLLSWLAPTAAIVATEKNVLYPDIQVGGWAGGRAGWRAGGCGWQASRVGARQQGAGGRQADSSGSNTIITPGLAPLSIACLPARPPPPSLACPAPHLPPPAV